MDSAFVLVGPPSPCRFIRPIPGTGSCRLGRSSQCELIVDDPSVSRWHAQLSVRGDLVRVADLGSRNGTFVDDAPIREAEVAHGGRLRFGDVPLLLTTRDALSGELEENLAEGHTPAGHRPSPLKPPAPRLTVAQRHVFNLLVEGLPEKLIAGRLEVSVHTVHVHVGAIYKAFRVHSRSALLARVLQQRLVAVGPGAPPVGWGPESAGLSQGEGHSA